ncbi:MAG: hypothetical protein COB92_08050 [Robiginitomaculum sp.]|nr:MAG: hypothetical protein COB92_08050 [Robiginitomaculum sp.]
MAFIGGEKVINNLTRFLSYATDASREQRQNGLYIHVYGEIPFFTKCHTNFTWREQCFRA